MAKLGQLPTPEMRTSTGLHRHDARLQHRKNPTPVRAAASLDVLAGMLAELDRQIGALDADIDRRARESEVVTVLNALPAPAACYPSRATLSTC